MEELENWDFRVSLGYVFVTVAQKQKGKKKMKLYLVLCIETGCFHTLLGFILEKQTFQRLETAPQSLLLLPPLPLFLF